MKYSFLALVSLSFLAISPREVRADECGNVTSQGICQDHKTLVLCQNQELQVLDCPPNEVCVSAHSHFGGAAGCLPSQLTDCQGIPAQGVCVGDSILYCEQGRLVEMVCPGSTTCEQNLQNNSQQAECRYSGSELPPDGEGDSPPRFEEDGLSDPSQEDYAKTDTESPPPQPTLDEGELPFSSPDRLDELNCQSASSPLWLLSLLPLLSRRLLGRRR